MLKDALIIGISFLVFIHIIPSITLTPENLATQGSPLVVSRPGDELEITDFKPLHSANLSHKILNDIVSHLPQNQVNHFKFDGINTWAHESTHGVNAQIRNTLAGQNQQGLYILNDKAVILDQPKLTLAQISEVIPESLRGSRYQLYFKQQQRDWNNFPLYVLDEQVAYTNGTLAQIDADKGMTEGHSGATDDLIAVVEFDIYMIYTAVAIEKHDPEYFKNNKQFKEYLGYQLRLGFPLYTKYKDDPRFKWDSKLPQLISEDKTAQECLNRLFGNNLINIKQLLK